MSLSKLWFLIKHSLILLIAIRPIHLLALNVIYLIPMGSMPECIKKLLILLVLENDTVRDRETRFVLTHSTRLISTLII